MTIRPPIDPWLAHLRRDRRGLPVPYVNLWGEQTEDTMYVQHDPNVGRAAVYVREDPGALPNFLKQCWQRQRECMVRGLCQVCGRFVPWSRRNVVIAAVSVDFITVGGKKRAAVFEPWLDDRCAHIALNWCPALIRRTRDEGLTLVPVRSPREGQLVVSSGWIDGPFEEQTKANPVAMLVKLLLLDWDIQTTA